MINWLHDHAWIVILPLVAMIILIGVLSKIQTGGKGGGA